jgi:signal transduction histidine kinase
MTWDSVAATVLSRHMDMAQGTRLTFRPGVSTEAICEAIHAVDLPLDRTDQNLARYAMIEVIMNAVRASVAVGGGREVSARVWADDRDVRIVVEDSAGGFDMKALPYDFGGDPQEVDTDSDAFQVFRRRCHDERFGLGLLMVRRAVKDFRLAFVDDAGRETSWRGEGTVAGTRVHLGFKRSSPCQK